MAIFIGTNYDQLILGVPGYPILDQLMLFFRGTAHHPEDQSVGGLSYIPNSGSVFQSLGPGTGDTKMHAPKNRNRLAKLG